MSEPAPPSPPPVPAPPQPGFFQRAERAVESILPRAEHAAADVAVALEDHAGSVLDITAEAVALLKLADPADAALFSAITALAGRVLGVAVAAKTIAGTARGQVPPEPPAPS